MSLTAGSKPARAAVAIGSIAVLAVLFVVLSGGEDEAEQTSAPGPAVEVPKAPEGGDGPPAERPRPARVEPVTITVAAEEGDVERLSYRKGERIRLAFASEVADQLHIHGYDRYIDLEPGEVSRVRFPAEIEGVFEIELHGTGAEIARLTVKP